MTEASDASEAASPEAGLDRQGLFRAFLSDRLVAPAQAFMQNEVSGGVVVLVAAVIAFAWANSPWSAAYFDLWHSHIVIETGLFTINEDLGHFVNDGLMAIFFFVIGLETKRELLHGELAGFRKAALPVTAALGGMIVPAGIYSILNATGEGAKGWGVPMATDIAFALGVLALLGRRIPFPLRVFLMALAVADDIGAIAVIAIFYTSSLSFEASMYALIILAFIFGARQVGVRSIDFYVIVGAVFWLAVYKSGIHATIAGVVLALLTPASPDRPLSAFRQEAEELLAGLGASSDDLEREQTLLNEFESAVRNSEAPLERLERHLHPWVVFTIVPIFALANAGVEVTRDAFEGAVNSPITFGVAFGLLFGKPIGIFLASWLAVRTGLAALPHGVGWIHIAGAGILAGIGFTVALFVTDLAFDAQVLKDEAKLGILSASLLAAVLGYGALRLITRPATAPAPAQQPAAVGK
jgi:NhaA family Na+:H+ antiporter